MADLPIHETLRDDLEDFEPAIRRVLLKLLERASERDDLGAAGRAPCRDRFEASRMPEVAGQDFFALSGVHGPSIGLGTHVL